MAKGFLETLACLETQSELAYCGLASLVTVLNTLRVDPGEIWKGTPPNQPPPDWALWCTKKPISGLKFPTTDPTLWASSCVAQDGGYYTCSSGKWIIWDGKLVYDLII